MATYYLLTTILVLISFIILIFRFDSKKINLYFLCLFLLMTISCGGNLFLSLSTSLSEAILANKIAYLGGCFVPPITFFLICQICNYKIKTWLRNLLYLYSFIVYGFVLTIGFYDFYYKDISLINTANAASLNYSYGIGHTFFYVILYGYIICEIILLLYSFYKKHTVSRKSIELLIILNVVNIGLFIFSRNLNLPFEIMPLMYVIDSWILLYLQRRTMMYNIEDCVNSSLNKQDSFGYIAFDKHLNYLGCNHVAKQILPDLAYCKVDLPVKQVSQLEPVLCWVTEYAKGISQNFNYKTENRHYQCTIDRIFHKGKTCGYIIEMQDDTDKWNYLQLLSSYNSELENEVQKKTQHISNIQSHILIGMASIVENRDDNTGGHIRRTSDVIRILVNTIQEKQLLDLEDQFCIDLIKAAPMHDLGKIAIDDTILRKPGKLTEAEFSIMQTHAEKSALLVEQILNGIEDDHFLQTAIHVAKYHHEKWNGSGYPEHLKGEEIPLEARIMAIADVYDALVSKRCYKEPMSFEMAAEIMLESMGSHFDPQLAQVFIHSRQQLEAYYSA